MATAELLAAIDELYDAFASYPRRPFIEGCECCWSGGVDCFGGDRPLREVTREELDQYAYEGRTLGTTDDFKHYLPRLFEIGATSDFAYSELSTLVWRLTSHDDSWTEWPAVERAALGRFLHALWRDLLGRDDVSEVADVLGAIARVEPEIDWYLAELDAAPAVGDALVDYEAFRIHTGEVWQRYTYDREHIETNNARFVEWARLRTAH